MLKTEQNLPLSGGPIGRWNGRRSDVKSRLEGDSPMDKTDQSLVALRRILLATELYERLLARKVGLSGAQLRVLQIVAEKGGVTPTVIATRMGVTQATITGLVHRLEDLGMVERERSEKDRRQTLLMITAAGQEAVDNAPDPLQQSYVQRFEALPDWEQSMIVAALERVTTLLNADDIDASPVLTTAQLKKPN